jgi:polyferredoxin
MGWLKKHVRHWVQLLFTALTNSHISGFLGGTIYSGPLKSVCLPGLNCYSCPGSLGACPVGSLQAVLGSRNFRFSFYIVGFLTFCGALLGRFVCGWLCPFGLVQDLLHKIPVAKKRKILPGDRILKHLKYAILLGFVVLLPLFAVGELGVSDPWFCKYICPSGTLMGGWPLVAANPALRAAVGWLFAWKSALLIGLMLLSVFVFRPFCRYICPLGAIYGLFNRISLYRFSVDADKCTACGACHRACPTDIKVYKTPNSPDCIRCGKCLGTCPHQALTRQNRCLRNSIVKPLENQVFKCGGQGPPAHM